MLALISLLIEGIECFSGWWGVKRQGGSAAAGWAAMGGGLLGGIAGGMVPPGLVWALVGMLAGSFIAVYWVEHNRLGHSGHAVRVATGALLARVGMLFVKVVASLGMGGFVVWVLLVELFRG